LFCRMKPFHGVLLTSEKCHGLPSADGAHYAEAAAPRERKR
jgi:hypothetical protein